jgi:hypothetical protein
MNWKNIDLTDKYEREQNILDPYDSETLLLEIHCNVKTINKYTVKEQAMLSIRQKYETAIQILNDNLDNLTAEALRERAIP